MKFCIKAIKYLIIILLISCQSGVHIDKKGLKEYAQIKELYSKNLTNHFPKIDNEKVVFLGLTFPRGTWLSGIRLIINYDEDVLNEIRRKAEIESIKKYTFQDSCLMITEYDSTLYKTAPVKLRQCLDCEELLPVPNFKFCIDAGATSEFYKNAIIYVLGAEEGKFLENNHLTKDGVGLSKKWKHGYTKGILISGNLTAYWLEVW